MSEKSSSGVGFSPWKVVAIGGGTGLSTLLRGLKRFVSSTDGTPDPQLTISKLSAIVAVTDDGGSSGRLRKDMGIPPPGDIRNCMVALAEDEALLSRLFQYRFSEGEGLEGHNFGNLFLTALTRITGDFSEAVKLSTAILKSHGDIYPVTNANVWLIAEMDDGSHVRGETKITASKKRVVKLSLVPADVQPHPETLRAIGEADLITIGPGSLFTSLVPNLIVHGIPEAIAASTAVKAYVCNIMTQENESLDLSAADHIRALFSHAGRKVFDYVLINQATVSSEIRAKYAEQGCAPVETDLDAVRALGVHPILSDYLDRSGLARHNSARVAQDLLSLVARIHAEKNFPTTAPSL